MQETDSVKWTKKHRFREQIGKNIGMNVETGEGTEENIPFLNVLVIQRGK